MAKNEMSERVLELTEDIIGMNPAHYTVWYVLARLDMVTREIRIVHGTVTTSRLYKKDQDTNVNPCLTGSTVPASSSPSPSLYAQR